MSAQFGEALVDAQSQTGFPDARCAYLENSSCLMTAQAIDLNTGLPFVPAAVAYRVDDVLSQQNVVPLTSITPALLLQVIVTSAQNAMISLSLNFESRQVLFQFTDGLGNVTYASVFYDLVRTLNIQPCCEDFPQVENDNLEDCGIG